jgi:hypothetical protein
MMHLWKNKMGILESEEQMSDEDFLVENNIVCFECSNGCSSTISQYVIETLQDLHDVSKSIFAVLKNITL